MIYNMSFMDTNSTLYEIAYQTNSLSGGIIFLLLLGLMYIIIFAQFKNFDTVVDHIITGFIVTIMASLMWFAGFIGWHIAIVPLIMLFASLGVKFFKG